MRFGTCVGFDKLESAAKLGYDYLESNLGHIKSLGEQELKNTKAMLDGYGAKLEAVNCFFPGEIHLAGEDADIEIIRDYTRRAFDNAVFLGIKTCVLGSGRSRSVPDGFDREKGLEQIHSALRVIDDEAGKHGIRIAIEPLNRLETNVFTTVRESVNTCRTLRLKTYLSSQTYIIWLWKRGLRRASVCRRQIDTYTLLEPDRKRFAERRKNEAHLPRRRRRIQLRAVCRSRKESRIRRKNEH